MDLSNISATRFSKVMGSGRTQPCLMVCEDEAGEEVEVVVKLRKHPQILPGGFVADAMAFRSGLAERDLAGTGSCDSHLNTSWN